MPPSTPSMPTEPSTITVPVFQPSPELPRRDLVVYTVPPEVPSPVIGVGVGRVSIVVECDPRTSPSPPISPKIACNLLLYKGQAGVVHDVPLPVVEAKMVDLHPPDPRLVHVPPLVLHLPKAGQIKPHTRPHLVPNGGPGKLRREEGIGDDHHG